RVARDGQAVLVHEHVRRPGGRDERLLVEVDRRAGGCVELVDVDAAGGLEVAGAGGGHAVGNRVADRDLERPDDLRAAAVRDAVVVRVAIRAERVHGVERAAGAARGARVEAGGEGGAGLRRAAAGERGREIGRRAV